MGMRQILFNRWRCVCNVGARTYTSSVGKIDRIENLSLPQEENHLKSSNFGKFKNGPSLKDFLVVGKDLPKIQYDSAHPYLRIEDFSGHERKVFFEIYGCQMNVNDTELVWAILKENNYTKCTNIKDADVILLITCSIREGAETKIWNRLKHLNAMKRNRTKRKGPLQVGVLGCMAERLKTDLVEKEQWVDVVAGPDSYKDLPRLLSISKNSISAVNVLLSLDETYADVMPVRLNENSVTAFVSIMRGCDNMCSYCIVPFTRGKERSRPIQSIENEVKMLAEQGVREITLLGQNVNSYRELSTSTEKTLETKMPAGFRTVYKPKLGGIRFAELLERVANSVPEVRLRFTSPHPKDFPDDVLQVIRKYPNICKSLHLPAQSGNSNVLERMRRGYTREAYLDLVGKSRTYLPEVALSSDFICGFCGETESEFEDTLSLIEQVKYNTAFLFAYSMREKTTAHRRYKDDVPQDVKQRRLVELIKIFRKNAEILQRQFVGRTELILVEGISKRSDENFFGRNDANIKVIVPNIEVPVTEGNQYTKPTKPGDFIAVRIVDSNSQVLKGEPLYHTTLSSYSNM